MKNTISVKCLGIKKEVYPTMIMGVKLSLYFRDQISDTVHLKQGTVLLFFSA